MSVTPFYIYRHIRPDKNEVFYIGKGSPHKRGQYHRAFWRYTRNNFWHKVVDKNDGVFDVEIMYECETQEECDVKEREFISLYGRRNNKTGTLVNMTDGGEGVRGLKFSEESKRKMSEAQINSTKGIRGKKAPIEWVEKRRKSLLASTKTTRGKNHHWYGGKEHNKKVIDTTTGVIYESITLAAKESNINRNYLYCMLYGVNKNKTSLIYYNGQSL